MTTQRHKVVKYTLIAVVGVTVGIAVFNRVQQHVFSNRVKHTLAEVPLLPLGSRGVCDTAARWEREWGSNLKAVGNCAGPGTFDMQIDAAQPSQVRWYCFKSPHDFRRVFTWGFCPVYRVIAGRTAMFRATVRAQDGITYQNAAALWLEVPDDESKGEPALMVGSVEGFSRFTWKGEVYPQIAHQPMLHPAFRVLVHNSIVNADYDPGPTVYNVTVEFGPDASNGDIDRLAEMNVGCITQFTPCTRSELMPNAVQQYMSDSQKSPTFR